MVGLERRALQNAYTTVGKSTTLDYLIPPETIAQLSQGEFCGVIADTFEQQAEQKIFHAKIQTDKGDLNRHPIPALYQKEEQSFNRILEQNLEKVAKEVEALTKKFLK